MSASHSLHWNSVLGEDIKRYVLHKRGLGRKYVTEERALHLFDRFLCEGHADTLPEIDSSLVEAFVVSRQRASVRSHNHLLGVVRCFFDWLVVQERIERSPVRARPRRAGTRPMPFLFNPDQARLLLDASRALPDWPAAANRGPTYHLVFAMMYALGLRIGEVSRLQLGDVDFERRVLWIRKTKFAKDRLVPFGPRLETALAGYVSDLDRRPDARLDQAPLFSFRMGRPVSAGTISQTFHHLVTGHPAFVPPPGVSPPRPHSLRHSFAVGTLLRWYRSGIDVSERLIHLSTFLGHVSPESTAWYLTITPELLEQANHRFERYAAPAVEGCVP